MASRSWEEDFKDLSSTKRERDGEEGERGGRFKYEYARHAPVSKNNYKILHVFVLVKNKKQLNNNLKQNKTEKIFVRDHTEEDKIQ